MGKVTEYVMATEEKSLPKLYDPVVIKSEDISPHQYQQLLRILHKYPQAFAKHEHDLGQCSIIKHHITLTDSQPICQRAYRTPIVMEKEYFTAQCTFELLRPNETLQLTIERWSTHKILEETIQLKTNE